MRTRSGALGLLLVVLCGCGKKADRESPTSPEPLSPATASVSDAAPSATPDVTPTAPEVPTTPVSTEDRRAALLATLPALDDSSLPADPTARYELATKHVQSGDPLRGLAVLRQLATAEGCETCARIATTARGDRAWQSQWSKELFAAIVPSEGGLPREWWAKGGAGCPKGTRLVRKKSRNGPEEGRAWCEKAGGVKHGPYWWYESECHEGEGTCSTDGTYADGKEHGWWSLAPNYYGEEHGFFDRGKRVGLWYQADNELQTDAVYVDGVLHGTMRIYRVEDSELIAEGSYEKGKRASGWTHWDPSDGSSARGAYAGDAPDGTWSVSGAAGQPGHTLTFRAGALIEIDGKAPTDAQHKAWEASRQNWFILPVSIARDLIAPPAAP